MCPPPTVFFDELRLKKGDHQMSDPDIKEDNLISQVNIDKFLNSTEESDSDDALWELSQDDIDTLMNSDPFDSEEDIDTDEDDDDMELISQDDIDNLMNLNTSDSEDDEGPENSTEPVILDEESTSDSKEKIDLKESDEDVSQEDIDALLLDDDDLLISQDDIDTLLMAVDQEDEDVLGDLMDEDSDDGIDDEDDEDDEDDYEEYILKNDEDQVILEDDDSEEVADTESKTKWYKSKLIIVCASALISIGIIVPAVYYLLFYGDSSQTKDTMEQYAVEGLREIEIEIVDSNVGIEGYINSAGNMVLKNFVILASDLSEEMAYITTDVSIDYSDQRAYHEIQNNLSFYRDLIYSSINESLASGKHDKITEADILWKIEKTLKKVLPGTYIDRVSFKSFRAS
jgi:pilus assembly protein FimV